jgi:phosphoribosylformimino-5-aminoimidazole carboxamide ribotide isomerase
MIIFPAIDLKEGQVVRLKQGDFNQLTVFDNDPVKVAKSYQEDGAEWLHVIDLDGAQTGTNKNIDVIEKIVKESSLKVQVGGGIRDKETIERLLSLGVTRVILGSFAITHLDQISDLVKAYPNQIIVSIDAMDGYVTYSGWQKRSKVKVLDLCHDLENAGIKTIVYTDILKDGMMIGPNFKDYKLLQDFTQLEIIASGGVSSIKDVKRLNKMNMYGAIIGKALYLNTISVGEVLACLQDE